MYENFILKKRSFYLPDLRECVPVGAGESTRAGIAAHDVYTVGQFKDDQLQGHIHHYKAWNVEQMGRDPPGNYLARNRYATSTSVPQSDGVNGTPRTGTTTHGKQVGVNYLIKY